MAVKSLMEVVAAKVTQGAGSSGALFLATLTIVVWLVSGPFFNFSDTWQLVINTGTTIVTFLMVFLIQRTQNKESHATNLKLNELIAALHGASNKLICVEDLPEAELAQLRQRYKKLAEKAAIELPRVSHTIEDVN